MTDISILMKDILKSRYTDFFIVWTKWWVFMLCYNSFILHTKTKLCKKSKSVRNLSILGYFDDGHQAVPKWAEWPFWPSVLRHSGCVTHTPTHLTIKHTSKYHVHSVLHTPTYQIGGHRLLFYVVVFFNDGRILMKDVRHENNEVVVWSKDAHALRLIASSYPLPP